MKTRLYNRDIYQRVIRKYDLRLAAFELVIVTLLQLGLAVDLIGTKAILEGIKA